MADSYRISICPQLLIGSRSVFQCEASLFLIENRMKLPFSFAWVFACIIVFDCYGAETTTATSGSAVRVLRAGVGLDADTPQGRGMQRFADIVNDRSRGRLRIDVYASAKLGNDLPMISALQKGTQDITSPDSSTLVELIRDFMVINYPFTFLGEKEADYILDGPWGQGLLDALPTKNLVGLAFWENGFRQLTNSKRAITSMAQVKGIRMRTMQNQMLIDSFNELGFEAVPMAFPKVYPALADKQVDGQENPLPTILLSKFYEVQQHLTLSRHVYSAFVLLISKQTWDSLAPDDRAILSAAAVEARGYQRRLNREVAAAALDQLKKLGMQVTSIEVRDAELVRRRLRPVFDKYNKEVGERSVVSMYVALSQLRADQAGRPISVPMQTPTVVPSQSKKL